MLKYTPDVPLVRFVQSAMSELSRTNACHLDLEPGDCTRYRVSLYRGPWGNVCHVTTGLSFLIHVDRGFTIPDEMNPVTADLVHDLIMMLLIGGKTELRYDWKS